MKRKIFFLVLFWFCVLHICMAQKTSDEEFEIANKYYKSHETVIHDKAIPILSRLVKKDDAQSLNLISDMYESINNSCYNLEKSIAYRIKAAELGLVKAQYRLAEVYHTDYHVADKDKGIYWAEKALQQYKRLALKGNANAMFMTGKLYSSGWLADGVNWKDAIEWYEKAASQNNTESMDALGWYYYSEREYEKAYDYYLKGAKLYNSDCQIGLGTIIYNQGKEHPEWVNAYSLFCAALFEDKGGINSWYYKAANEGSYDAEAAIGLNKYWEGQFEEAKKRLEKAKEGGVKRVSQYYKLNEILGATYFYLKNPSYITENNGDFGLGSTKDDIYITITKGGKKGVVRIDGEGKLKGIQIPCVYDYIFIETIEHSDEVYFVGIIGSGGDSQEYIIDLKGNKDKKVDICESLKKYGL